ncbi:unnamed protein product [Pleuronectes platessa]|uniref:Uncharacterized protein n=1 Tax=Pleuronectes platessa TaxID=8262 RepID=A0A9N7TYY6_PLEPL|nr:unnamed protein product [Pleuronectes platessa]
MIQKVPPPCFPEAAAPSYRSRSLRSSVMRSRAVAPRSQLGLSSAWCGADGAALTRCDLPLNTLSPLRNDLTSRVVESCGVQLRGAHLFFIGLNALTWWGEEEEEEEEGKWWFNWNREYPM